MRDGSTRMTNCASQAANGQTTHELPEAKEEVSMCATATGKQPTAHGQKPAGPALLERAAATEPMSPASQVESLCNRELEVFEMIGRGLTTRVIAARLHLSPRTVDTYRERLKIKLALANSAELHYRAVQWVLKGT